MDIVTKRQLKQQDQFITTTERGIEWAKTNRQSAAIAAALVVLLILGSVGGYVLYQHRTNEASTAFGNAMATYQTPLATVGQPTPPGVKTFPDAKARAAAANAQFLDVAAKFNLTEPGKLAQYFAGLTYLEEGQNGSAEDTLKKVSGSWNSDTASLAKLALAQLYQQTGRDSDAAKLYNELAAGHATTVPPGLAKLQLAEMYESEGKTADAHKIYAELKDKDKDAKGNPGPAGEVAANKLNPKAAGPR